jgi:hypothetical protein
MNKWLLLTLKSNKDTDAIIAYRGPLEYLRSVIQMFLLSSFHKLSQNYFLFPSQSKYLPENKFFLSRRKLHP